MNNTIFSGTREFQSIDDNLPTFAPRIGVNAGRMTRTSQTSSMNRKGRGAESLLVESSTSSSTIPRQNNERIYRQPAHIQKPPRGANKNKRLSNTTPTLKLPQHQSKTASLSSSSNYSTAKSTLSSDEVDAKNEIHQDKGQLI